VAGACESADEFSGFTKCWELLDQLRTSWLLTKDSAPWSYLFFIHSVIHSFNCNKITSLLLTSRDPPQVSNIYVWPTYWLSLGHFAFFYGTRNSAELYVGVTGLHPRDGCLHSHGRANFNSH
jgi:hypothetical protein